VGQGAAAGVGQGAAAGVGQAGQKPDAAEAAGENARIEQDAAQNPTAAQDTTPASKPAAGQREPAEKTETVLPARQNSQSETAAETAVDLLQGAAVLRPAALSRRKVPIPGEGLAFFPAADRPAAELTLDPSPAQSLVRSADEPDESPAFPAEMTAAFRLGASEPTQSVPTAVPAAEEPPESSPWQPPNYDNSTADPPAGLAGGGNEEETV
ncbi:MAG: hypothetical protein HFE86_02905, partial [Clostridiales bacterium]|nr:hypothetical protein [Clostridiales bacterium]